MAKIKLHDLISVLNTDVVKYNSCIEINFCIDNDSKYNDCWIGKMYEQGKDLYWYGLVTDGSQAYEYDNLDDILNAKVFHGKSMCDFIEK
ncbi:MAG: hypothetical protein ACRC7N_00390 [Clostridium sp.]